MLETAIILAAMKDWVSPGVAGGVAGGLASAVFARHVLRQGQNTVPRHDRDASAIVFIAPPVFKWVGCICAIVFIGVLLLFLSAPLLLPNDQHPTTPIGLSGIVVFSVFAIGSICLVLDAQSYQISVEKDGLRCTSFWKGTRLLPWNDIQQIGYNSLADWFVLHAGPHGTFRIPRFVGAGKTLFQILTEKLGADVFTPFAKSNLSRL